jgi:hypothetical protein
VLLISLRALERCSSVSPAFRWSWLAAGRQTRNGLSGRRRVQEIWQSERNEGQRRERTCVVRQKILKEKRERGGMCDEKGMRRCYSDEKIVDEVCVCGEFIIVCGLFHPFFFFVFVFQQFPGFELIICGKRRGENDSRIVTILDGDCKVWKTKQNQNKTTTTLQFIFVFVVERVVTCVWWMISCDRAAPCSSAVNTIFFILFLFFACFGCFDVSFCFCILAAKALLDHEAAAVSFFVVHAEFPQESWRKSESMFFVLRLFV